MILGGKGTLSGLFVGLAFASVPWMFGIPFSLLPLALGLGGDILSGLVQFGLLIWVVVPYGVAIRENNGFTTGRAIAALVIPLTVLFGLRVLLILLLVVVTFAVIGGAL